MTDGGSEIKEYHIERKDAAKTLWVTAGSVDSHTFNYKVTKLFEGTKYNFRVTAENKIGIGDAAETENSVEAKLPYGMYSCQPLCTIHILFWVTYMFVFKYCISK